MTRVREEIRKLIEKAIKELQEVKRLPKFDIPGIKVEKPENKEFGDYSTNVAMVLAKKIKKSPTETTGAIKSKIKIEKLFKKVAIKDPGFINFFLSDECLQKQIGEILKQKDKFGQLKIGKNQKINVEFISANPTGPLTLGNGRGGFFGDVLSNLLNKAGYKVEREYYINDIGEQIRKLGHSLLGDSEAVYNGPYIEELRKKIKGVNTEEVGKKAAAVILEEMIRPSVKKMGIKFNTWFYESKLHKKKEVDKILEELEKKNLSYRKEDALWFRSTNFGDDKDRVLIKDDGEKTYLTSDVAYLKNKFKRGFQRLIFFWGADHYGYVGRIKAAAEALGYKKEQIDIIIMQLVRLLSKGKEVRMSKRTGTYIVLDELIDEVGLDVTRFFFLTKSPDTHLNFDLDLAKEQSEKNPVYYVQYAYARICSILRKAKSEKRKAKNYELLTHPSELELIKQLIRLPEIIEDTEKDYQVQRLPQYAVDLATAFHQFYRDCKVLTEVRPLREDRIGLILTTKIVLKNTLGLMGISAPEKM